MPKGKIPNAKTFSDAASEGTVFAKSSTPPVLSREDITVAEFAYIHGTKGQHPRLAWFFGSLLRRPYLPSQASQLPRFFHLTSALYSRVTVSLDLACCCLLRHWLPLLKPVGTDNCVFRTSGGGGQRDFVLHHFLAC